MLRFLFEYASDRYGGFYPARLLPELIWAILWLAIFVCAVHALRRARHNPTAPRRANYILNQRLYHWGNFALLAVLALSGYYLFFRRPPEPPLAATLGVSWLSVHEWAGLLFAAGVAFHALASVTRGEPAAMRPALSDVADLWLAARNFLGQTRAYPQPGKYDAWQKLYHAALAVLAITFTASGALMWLSLSRRAAIPRVWLQWSRLAHDLAAVLLAALVIGHVYFSLLKVNRENLRDMVGLKSLGHLRSEAVTVIEQDV